jgi:hypothetical protein
LPIAEAAEESPPAADASVTGHSALCAIEYAPCGVEHGRQVAIAIISGEKTATGPIASIVNGLTLYFHHSAETIFGFPKSNQSHYAKHIYAAARAM